MSNIYEDTKKEILAMKVAKGSRSGNKGVKLYKPLLILSMLDYHLDQGDETLALNNPTNVELLVDFFTIYLENEIIQNETYNDAGNIFERKNILHTIRTQPLYHITKTTNGNLSKIFLNNLPSDLKTKPRSNATMATTFEIRVPADIDLSKLTNIIRSACYAKIAKETGILIQDSIITDLRKKDIERSIYYRRGQDQYRRKLLEKYACKCAFCNFDVEHALVASHAKPWKDCTTVSEKLSENNGFLLCANHDRMFDKGYISINIYNNSFMFSGSLKGYELDTCKKSLPNNFQETMNDEMRSYIKYHSEKIFKAL